MNRFPVLKVVGVILLVSGLQSYGQQADAGAHAAPPVENFIVFDVPGSTCEPSFPICTTPVAINPEGAITGYYADSNAALHSFLRAGNGTFTTFDPPGSTCPSFFSECSQPTDLNPAGAITGSYCDAITCHGFLRVPDGNFTTLDPPGSIFTQANGINPAGAITGYYIDASFVEHGFVRARDGTFTTFDVPDAVNGTNPSRINPEAAITGWYYDASSFEHGFLRTSNGTFTTFDSSGLSIHAGQRYKPAGRDHGILH